MKNLALLFLLVFTMPSFGFELRKPAKVYFPKDFNKKDKYPLIISLHGFLSNPSIQNKVFSANKFVDSKGIILITPFGLRNRIGIRYWNGSDTCCDFFNQNPDDISYLKKLIGKAKENYPIDSNMIFLVGHSNGGFLAYRFACEAADLISGIVSIAGSNSFDQKNCHPTRPVSILQIHGTNDKIINYEGNTKRHFPSALESITPWASLNHCQKKENFQISENITSTGFGLCEGNKSVELWTVQGRRHNEALGDDLTENILDYLSI